MKRFFYLLLLTAVAASASCTREPAVEGSVPDRGGNADADNALIAKGWVRIRLSPEASPLRVGSFTRGEAESGNPDLDRIAASLGATEIRKVFPLDPRFAERHRKYGLHLWYDVRFDEEVPVSRAQTQFTDIPGVEYVQPIYMIEAVSEADYPLPSEMSAESSWEGNKREMPFNDPGLPMQWNYDNDGTLPQSKEGADINIFEVWRRGIAGDPSVIVAVMDSGVEFTHEDLAANMWVNEAELNGNPEKDDDNNGYEDDVHGYDFYFRTSVITPGDHGTHVAGTVAAVNNNGIGVCGVAGGTGKGDGVRIMTCAIYDNKGYGMPGPNAYIYAADNGAVISQNSWDYPTPDYGGPTKTPEDMLTAFQYFIDNAGIGPNGEQTGPMKGGVIIFAAGNSFSPVLKLPSNDPRVLAVTAMSPNYKKAAYSNYNPAAALCAPGGAGSDEVGDQGVKFAIEGKVYSLDLNNSYKYMSGTSMACPHVSGVAALIVSHYGVGQEGFTNKDLRERLLRSYRSIDIYQLSQEMATALGAGLLDASLIGLEDPGVAPETPESVTPVGTKEGRLTAYVVVPADGNGMGIASMRMKYAKEGTPDGSPLWVEEVLPCRISVGEAFEYEVDNLEDATTYVFQASAIDRFGNESGTAEGSGRTIDHINRPPVASQPMSRLTLPQGSGTEESDFVATIDLSDHFSDPDLPEDALSYEAESNDPAVAKVSVAGSMLTIDGFKTGETFVRITVTDLAGESISKNMAVRVLRDRETTPTPPPTDPAVELQEGVLNLFPNPAPDGIYLGVKGAEGMTVDIDVYDTAARRVISASGLQLGADGSKYAGAVKVDVSKLSPGSYSVSASLSDGRRLRGSFLKR